MSNNVSEAKWFIVNTMVGYESRAAELIREVVVSAGMQDAFEDVVVPMETVKKTHRGKKVVAEKKMMPALAQQFAISLANAKLYHMAITDGLTDLFSQRYFRDELSKMVLGYEKDRASFSLIMLDIDFFKEVNDSYGHQVGDHVLSQIADIIKETVRYGDIPCRYGGEEFAVLLPNKINAPHKLTEIAERLRKTVEDYLFICKGAPIIRKTISLGIASFPENAQSAEDLIKAADHALYAAKNDGRNVVRAAS